MSRSDPPRSSIVARLRQNSSRLPPSPVHPHSLSRKLSIRFAKLMRWLHIYLSMFGLAAVLFFSVTGITLNHPDWAFGQVERGRKPGGQMDLKWIARRASGQRCGVGSVRIRASSAIPIYPNRSRSWRSSNTCVKPTRSVRAGRISRG